ncbi:MAG: mechanosensitive ion channel, partial [Firmicutes bacterium]|nr:mechanosensitive ion channel [Bacillota bacterium]
MDTLAKAIESIGVPTGIFNIENLVTALILLVVCLIVIKIIMRFVDRMLERSKVEKTMHSFIRSCVKYLLLFIAILIVASALGINITSLIALLGVLGLAVSLAVQGVLSNLAGGVMVLLSKPFKVGDYVLTGDTEGTVKEIGLTHTQIDTLDN